MDFLNVELEQKIKEILSVTFKFNQASEKIYENLEKENLKV